MNSLDPREALIGMPAGNLEEYGNADDDDHLEARIKAMMEAMPPHPCPHGNQWHDCDDCDRLADFAFDAARESR